MFLVCVSVPLPYKSKPAQEQLACFLLLFGIWELFTDLAFVTVSPDLPLLHVPCVSLVWSLNRRCWGVFCSLSFPTLHEHKRLVCEPMASLGLNGVPYRKPGYRLVPIILYMFLNYLSRNTRILSAFNWNFIF